MLVVEGLSRKGEFAPIDLQVIKAAGVTFAVSAVERVIAELGPIEIVIPERDTPGASANAWPRPM